MARRPSSVGCGDDEPGVVRLAASMPVAGPGALALPDDGAPGGGRVGRTLMAAIDSGASPRHRTMALVLLTDGNQNAGDAAVVAEKAAPSACAYLSAAAAPPGAAVDRARRCPDVVCQRRRQAVGRDRESRHRVAEATLVARQGDQELGRVPLRVAPGRSVVDAEVRKCNSALRGDGRARGAARGRRRRARRGTTLSVLGHRVLIPPTRRWRRLLRAGFEVERADSWRDQRRGSGATTPSCWHRKSRDDVPAERLTRPRSTCAIRRRTAGRGGRGIRSDRDGCAAPRLSACCR